MGCLCACGWRARTRVRENVVHMLQLGTACMCCECTCTYPRDVRTTMWCQRGRNVQPCRYAERFYQRVAHEIIDNYEELVESADPSAGIARSVSTDVRIAL